jgi:hypothetical protein
MPWQNALVDLVFDDLLAGDIASAEARWPKVWDDVTAGRAWQRWMLVGKMTAARADLALLRRRFEEAADWAIKAMEMARPVGRKKYETAARITLGRALVALGRPAEAVDGLRIAVSEADRLGTPPGRWQARAALGHATYAAGLDDEAAAAYTGAREIVNEMASGLAPERAKRLLSAHPIREVLEAGT